MSHLPSELLIYLYLQKNGRTTRENIAKAIGVSEGAITRAFHKMKECGIKIDKKRSGFFIKSALSKEDVMPLIEGVLLSKLLSPEESEALIQKVWNLLPKDQTSDKPPHIKSYKTHRRNVVRDTLFEHIKVLYRARANTKTVTFQLQAQKFMDEALRVVYEVLPLDIYFNDERYYLLALDQNDCLQPYRIDLMENVVEGDISFKKRPDEKSIAEWIRSTDSSLQAGDVVKDAKFFATKPGLKELYDAWGEDNLRVQPATPEETCFSVTLQIETNEKELINFALMHAPQIELIAPQDLRDLIRARAAAIQSKYLSSEEDKQGERYNSVLRGDGILYASDRVTRKRLEEKGKTHCVKHLAIDVVARDLSVLFNDYPNVRTIRFLNQDKIDLSGISHFKALEELCFSTDSAKKVSPTISNIAQLANCPLLKRLDLSGTIFNETDFKKVCPTWKNLDKLEIVGCELQNLDFLKDLPHLRFLYIGGKHLLNIDGLKDGKWLRHVVIDKQLYERFGASIKQGVYNKTISCRTPNGRIKTLWRKIDPDPEINQKLKK